MKTLYYVVEGLHVDQNNKLTRPVFTCRSLKMAIKTWKQNHTINTAFIQVRQDTNTGFRIAGELTIAL